MRHAVSLILITCILGLGTLLAIAAGPQLILAPVVTGALLILGMALLVSQMAFSEKWRISGIGGVLSLSIVTASVAISKNASWTGLLALFAGIGLLLVEAHIYPGQGIGVFAGIGGIFAGLCLVLSSVANIVFALVVSAVVTLLTFAAFLASLPKNQIWRSMGSRLDVCVGRSHIETVRHEETRVSVARSSQSRHLRQTVAETSAQKKGANRAVSRSQQESGGTPKSSEEQQQVVGDGRIDL